MFLKSFTHHDDGLLKLFYLVLDGPLLLIHLLYVEIPVTFQFIPQGGHRFFQKPDFTFCIPYRRLDALIFFLAGLFQFFGGLTSDQKEQDLGPLPRMRNGIERFFITDINNPAASATAASEIPVMWDETAGYNAVDVFNHVPGGSNVLYMDGHVEFLKWHSKFPANVTQMYVYLMQG